jgi:alpha-tubulin suppressor-like RCC1 family protein
MKFLTIVLSSCLLVACGGGNELSQASLPRPVAKAATVLSNNDIAVRMYQAFYGKAPSNADLTSYTAEIASKGESAFAAALAAKFAGTSDSVLAKAVLDNLGVTTTTVTASGEYATLLDALGQMFAYYGTNARGQIILNATKLLVDLSTDPTWGVAAVAYNNQAQANITYSTNSANTTAAVASTAVVKEISAGWEHTMVLKSDGTVWAWGGMNDYGQLGNGTESRGANPLPKQSLISSVSMISAGLDHSVAVKSDGTIWNWGRNGWKQLGYTSWGSSSPVLLSGLTNPKAVSAGIDHTMILNSDGTVWGVGKNQNGQLCDGTRNLGTDSWTYNSGSATPLQMVGANGVGYMSNVIAVATGASNTAIIKSDGTVWWCGASQGNQLQNHIGSLPLQVAGMTGAVDVAVADYRMYALKSDGTVWSWGLIVSDIDPYNGATWAATAVQVTGLNDVVAISSHTNHAVALKRDGTVWSWGKNDWGWWSDQWGKLGNNLKGHSATPVQVVGPKGIGYLTGITAVVTGSNQSLALRNDGTVWAWGNNDYGQLGNGDTYNSSPVPTQVAGLTASTLLAPSSLSATVVSGSVTLVWSAVTGAKSYNVYRSTTRVGPGTLLGNTASINYSDTSALSGTTYYYYVTAVAGTLESIPSNKVAALAGTVTGGGTTTSILKSVGGGFYHSAAVGTDGSLWTWGSNNFGELGKGTTSDASTPAKLTSISGVSAVTGGNDHTVVLKSDGTVWAWGYNYHGELGNGTKTGNTANSTPGQVLTAAATPLTGITAVRGGFWHNLALKSDGTVWAWGNNDWGQLGNGSATPSYGGVAYAAQVTGLSNVVAIAAGHWHSVAVKSDGSVWTWGLNSISWDANRNGQLGDGTTTTRLTPVRVLGVGGVGYLSGVAKVAAGAAFTLALKSDGTVYGWGTNLEGELGNGNKTTSLTPVQAGVSNITDLAAGYWLSLALKSDGTVWAWGQNDMGQLGNGTTQALTGISTPAAVSGLSSVTAIHAGASFGVALKSDGTVWAWGENASGQLGNSTISNSSTPVRSQGGGL